MQFSIFSGKNEFKIDKPIRLIELFAGIGSQAKALKNIGADFEHYKIVEFDKYAVKSYNAIHGTNFDTSDITKITAADLQITDIEKYCYIMTYSFPCQDLSKAGKQNGMDRGSGTRSGLLWEVERLLDECENLPQVLLMENVPDVKGKINIRNFAEWIAKLKSLGYKNYWQCLNAKDYGVAQNRDRCFMISIQGDYFYEFPQPIKLEKRLKDYLEENVEEKYYLNNATSEKLLSKIDYSQADKKGCDLTINNPQFRDVANTIKARYDSGIGNFAQDGTGVIEPVCLNPKIDGKQPSLGDRIYDTNSISTAITTSWITNIITADGYYTNCSDDFQRQPLKDLSRTLKSEQHDSGVIINNYKIRKLTPLECWRLMGFSDNNFYAAQKVNSNSQLYKQAGNSIIVDVLEHIFRGML